MVKTGIEAHLQGVHWIGKSEDIPKSKISGRLSEFLQYVAGTLLGTEKEVASVAERSGQPAVAAFTFMDKIIQQLYLGIEASSTPDSADSGVREFMASCIASLVQSAILGLSGEARQLAELTYTFLVRVFSAGPASPAAAALRTELPACFVSDVMTARRKVKMALLRKAEGRDDHDGAGAGLIGLTQQYEIESADYFFRMMGSTWAEERVAQLGKMQPAS